MSLLLLKNTTFFAVAEISGTAEDSSPDEYAVGRQETARRVPRVLSEAAPRPHAGQLCTQLVPERRDCQVFTTCEACFVKKVHSLAVDMPTGQTQHPAHCSDYFCRLPSELAL